MPRIIFFLSIFIMFFAAYALKVRAEDGLILAGNMVETVERTEEKANWQRWQRLSPEERARLKERYGEYQKLPTEEKERLRRNFE
ncbi:MAG: DUF3106 domain-containing protein, partial [Deltaproteobacteria bacterium]|nr:DUF3106 domain-containing protein [Deltaproteobacteria bacterium]